MRDRGRVPCVTCGRPHDRLSKTHPYEPGRGTSSEPVCVVPYCTRQGRSDCPYPTHPRTTAPARTTSSSPDKEEA